MAFTATTYWEVEIGADDTNNGGGFDTGVAGFPTDGAATLATSTAPVFTSASYTFVSPGDVGAWIFIKSGTNWTPGWYKITAVSAGAATLDAAVGHAPLFPFGLSTAVGCATTASPTGATWGIDYSQSTGSRFSSATFAIDATTNTKLTDGTNTIGKNWVGNIISITAGTGFTVQRVAVVSTSGTAATVDKSLGTLGSTGGTGRLGGALVSAGLAASLRVAGNTVYIQTGTYSITSASTNISGGCISDATGGATITWEGYATYRGDLGTAPILQASGAITTFVIFTVTGASTAGNLIRNITVDGVSKTSSQGFSLARRSTLYKCRAVNCTNIGFTVSSSSNTFLLCSATNVTGGAAAFSTGSAAVIAIACEAYSNTVSGFSGFNVLFCLSYGNTGANSDGFTLSAETLVSSSSAYGNGRDGFRLSGETGNLTSCISEGNTGFGFGGAGAVRPSWSLINCAAFSNSGGNRDTANLTGPIINFVTGSSSFFTNAAGTNFSLNNTSGAGAAARAAGFPGAFPAASTTGYTDIGAVQHADPAGLVPKSRIFTGF